MGDFFKFKKMITPIVIPILFWFGTIFSIIAGLVFIVMGTTLELGINGIEMVLMGLAYIFFGPIIVRVYCELLIILFSVNDKLSDIKDILKSQQHNQANSPNED